MIKVLIVSTEVNPYAKAGGLGDVIGTLPKVLRHKGIDARVVLPKYRTIRSELLENVSYVDSFTVTLGWRNQSASVFLSSMEVPTYLIENDYYFGRDGFYGYGDDFERFAFFSKASVEFLGHVDFKPDIIHFNDWHTGLGSVYLKDFYKQFMFFSDIKCLYTIHNIQYQGVFSRDILGSIDLNDGYFNMYKLECYGCVNYMKAGVVFADAISTVSDTYSKEIQSYGFGYGLEGVLSERRDNLYGILNGIDYELSNPKTDKHLFKNYDVDSIQDKKINKTELQKQLNLPTRDVPLFGIVSRLADQKGFDILAVAIEELLSKDIQLVVLGTGEGRYEHLFRSLAYRYPHKLSANIFFNEGLAQKIYGGADIFLMPSLFEPCGLGQLYAMRYGTIPVVRNTGGLADTVVHYNPETKTGNGIVFDNYDAWGLMWGINEALKYYYSDQWTTIIKNAMNSDFSWDRSAEKYVRLYKDLIGKK